MGSRDPEPERSNLPTVERENYAIGDELARGGMGRILNAEDRRLGRSVVIKELLNSQSSPALHHRRGSVWGAREPVLAGKS